MKKIIILLSMLLVAGFICIDKVAAQGVTINFNIGNQPAWGPVGYDYAEYYYFPDINAYYDVNSSMFHYMSRGRWVSSRYLPSQYKNYDLYSMYKVVINENSPWRDNANHIRNYARYKGNKSQTPIRDSREAKYEKSRNNRVEWVKSGYERGPRKGLFKRNQYREKNRRMGGRRY